MSVLEIIQLCVIGVAVLAILIYIIVMGIKNKWFSKIWDTIKVSIKEAEKKFPESGSGDKKKAYVLEKVKAKCNELGVPYALLKKLIDLAIDKVIEDYNVISK